MPQVTLAARPFSRWTCTSTRVTWTTARLPRSMWTRSCRTFVVTTSSGATRRTRGEEGERHHEISNVEARDGSSRPRRDRRHAGARARCRSRLEGGAGGDVRPPQRWARGHRGPQPPERDVAPRNVHALRGTWRRRPDGEGAAPGVVGERNAAGRYSRGAGDLRRTGARHQADRTGAWPSGARHRRRRVPGDGAARGSDHRDGDAVAARDGRS